MKTEYKQLKTFGLNSGLRGIQTPTWRSLICSTPTEIFSHLASRKHCVNSGLDSQHRESVQASSSLSRKRERERERGREWAERRKSRKKSGAIPWKNLRRCQIFCCWQDAVAGNLRRSSADRPAIQKWDLDTTVFQFGRGQGDRGFGYVRRRHYRSWTLLQTRRRECRSGWRYQLNSRPGKYQRKLYCKKDRQYSICL